MPSLVSTRPQATEFGVGTLGSTDTADPSGLGCRDDSSFGDGRMTMYAEVSGPRDLQSTQPDAIISLSATMFERVVMSTRP